MARYTYPIRDKETENIMGVATAASTAAELIRGYAERKSGGLGPVEYEVGRKEEEIVEALSEDGRVRATLLAYDKGRRKSGQDETVIVTRMKVNEPLSP
jgi:hypothetical protein